MSFQSIDINTFDFNELNKYFFDFVDVPNFNDNNTDNVNNIVDGVNNCKGSNNQRNTGGCTGTCTGCGSDKFVEDYSQGIVVCTGCGEVLRAIYDQNPEWKQYDDDDKVGARCSVSVNVLLPQSSLGTSVGGYANSRTKRLHSWVQMPYRERSLNNEFKVIHDKCQKAGILKCVEDDTKIMYKMASECKHQTGSKKGKQVITRGVNRKSIVAACLFFACIRNKTTRTSKEIAQLWGISEGDMNKGRRNLQKLFKIKDKARKAMLNTETSKPEHFIKRYCNALQIKNQYVDDAVKIAINIEKLNIASGHTPCTSAAASILLMAEIHNLEHITKKKLASHFDISDDTIFKTFKEMEPYKHILLNSNSTNEVVKQINKELETQEIPPEVLERMKKFGIEPKSQITQVIQPKITKSTNLKKSESNNSFAKLILEDDNASICDEELELDEDYDNCEFLDDEFGIASDNSSDIASDIASDSDKSKLNEELEMSLEDKYVAINKIIKTKSLTDIKKEMQVLMTSYDLIKGIRNDLDQYAKNNF